MKPHHRLIDGVALRNCIRRYDSRDGKYGENGNANKSNATIKSKYKGDRSQEGDIVLSSGQPVYGDVESVG